MRVIAGKLSGRRFEAPKTKRTHPMSEKARGGLFNVLGDIEGLTVLDAFAGSGALSFEAISRGAGRVTAIEVDKHAHSNILKNVDMLQIENSRIKVIRANVSSWSDNNPNVLFDIVLCDPPYNAVSPKLLEKIANHTRPGGVIVFSIPPRTNFDLPASKFQLLSSKFYGDARLVFYRKIS